MTQDFMLHTRINKPAAEVFGAIVKRDSIVNYFVDKTSGDLIEGQTIIWHWNDWGDHPVTVKTVRPNTLLEFTFNTTDWKKTKDGGYDVTVTIKVEALSENSSMLSISESGWRVNEEDGRKGSYDNCGGWQHMAMCLKAYLEHGINLRL